MECVKKIVQVCSDEFYKNDKTCKECRKELVRQNRAKNAEYYREYDKRRYQDDSRVKERHRKYQSSEAGKAAGNRAKRKWTAKNPIKKGAATMVGNAVRNGRLIKPDSCSDCGERHSRIHGHHDDYARPLVVRWLCAACHTRWHAKNGEGLNAV